MEGHMLIEWRFLAAMLVLNLACAPGPTGGLQPDRVAELPGGSGGIAFDDLWYSAALGKVVVAAGRTRSVVLVDQADLTTTVVGGMSDPLSAADGAGHVFAIDRGNSRVVVIDPATAQVIGSIAVEGSPDYVRYSEATAELWVTEPGLGRVEVLRLPTGSGFPVPVTFINTGGGAEGLTLNSSRGHAYVHLSGGKLGVLSLETRSVIGRWTTGCGSLHGIPTYDEALGIVFAGCSSAEVVALSLEDGRVLGRFRAPGGATILGYSPTLRHFYLRGDPGVPIHILGVSADGTFSELGTADAATSGHCLTADDQGGFWVCDSDRGRLLHFTDPFPATR
jgi:YVTN family beta-propeller protein